MTNLTNICWFLLSLGNTIVYWEPLRWMMADAARNHRLWFLWLWYKYMELEVLGPSRPELQAGLKSFGPALGAFASNHIIYEIFCAFLANASEIWRKSRKQINIQRTLQYLIAAFPSVREDPIKKECFLSGIARITSPLIQFSFVKSGWVAGRPATQQRRANLVFGLSFTCTQSEPFHLPEYQIEVIGG